MASKRTDQVSTGSTDLWSRIDAATKTIGVAARRIHEQASSSEFEAAVKTAVTVRTSIETLSRLSDEIVTAERSFHEKADRHFAELETNLRAALAERGWKTDGSWPSLYIEHGIPVEIEEKTRSVRVGGQKAVTSTVKSIVAVLEPLVAGLLPKNFVPQAFTDSLAEAYDDVKGSNAQVPVLKVYRGLVLRQQAPQFWKDARRDRFQELSLDQFRTRLARCLEAGCSSTSDRRELRMLPPLDPKDGIFVYQPAELRFAFVGRIEFVKV